MIVGRGSYASKNGDVFDGSFAAGKPQGVGVIDSPAEIATKARWTRAAGQGRYHSRNGDRVEAPFVDGKPQGKGVYNFPTATATKATSWAAR